MIFPVHLILFILCISPIDSIPLTTACHTIHVYQDAIFCAPFTGNSLFILDNQGKMQPITFTDNANYRIQNIAVTAFSCYLNNGRSIEKYYLNSGIRETVFKANDITSFIITQNEEVILSERQKREVIFLDFMYTPRFIMEEVTVKDMFYADTIINLLLQNLILRCDEYGNVLKEIPVLTVARRIFAYGNNIILFSPGGTHLYNIGDDVQKIELLHGVRDIAEHNNHIVILDNHGTTLFVYRKSDF
ncbi:hypothetical protein AMJ87_11790 [candidate division WOR_3 bacterium SM23_60]|uniref:Ommochrome-binding protein-like n=1 Tax=candidate division WOR_3 bacterium SM23_60 TaxID=1703780 RepID=A0A0S8G624_UNCW3|nr:MAG: hypothetical protein AMJ87_11790 [candidate division WOR_3 bacterium SM23_60]